MRHKILRYYNFLHLPAASHFYQTITLTTIFSNTQPRFFLSAVSTTGSKIIKL